MARPIKFRHWLFSARFRILALAVVAIVIPSIFLAGAGLKLNSEYRALTEELVFRAYRTTADGKISHILSRVRDQELNLLSQLGEYSLVEMPGRLPGLPREHPLAAEFFLLGPGREILYPPTRPEVLPEPVEPKTEPGGRGAEALLDSGYQLEIEKKLPAAAEKYRRCSDGPFKASLRIEALTSLGGCLLQMDRPAEAIAAYRRLSEEFEPRDVPVPYDLLAQYQIGKALEAAGQRDQAMESLLTFYRRLLSQPAFAREDTWEFFRGKTAESLASLVGGNNGGGGSGGDPIRQEFEKLRRADEEREAQRRFRGELTRWLAQQVEWDARSKPADLRQFHHFHETLEGQPFLVAYSIWPGEKSGKGAILGFQLNLEHVKQNILLPEVADPQFSGSTVFAILDANEKPALLPRSSMPQAAAQSGAYALVKEFPEIFGFWKLGILDPGNEGWRKVSQKQYLLNTALLALTIAVMMAGVYLTLRDMNRELELSRLKSDFVSNVSHELKTPLALIRMFSETLLLGRVKNKEKEREYYEVITRESERLTKLIDNVLDFSRIESGRKQYQFAPEDVAEIVGDTVDSYREELEREGFTLGFNTEEGLPDASVDRAAITQALLNLLNNAQKYSRDQKEIAVSVKARDSEIRIEVSDRGIGIPESEQGKIFEKFYRAEDDFVRTVRGSGLGLAITRHTMEAHGGRIEVRSRPGEGSAFTLVLPALPRPLDSERPSSPPDEPPASDQ